LRTVGKSSGDGSGRGDPSDLIATVRGERGDPFGPRCLAGLCDMRVFCLAKASCNSPLKVVIEANTVTFVNGAQRAVYPKLEQCFTCMGRDANIVLLSTDAMGDSPFMIHLDTTKKQPVLVDFSNDKKLGARFPFGSGALKKCA
jgi:hypothetical protein